MRYCELSQSKIASLAVLIAFICFNFMGSSNSQSSFLSGIYIEKSSIFIKNYVDGLRNINPGNARKTKNKDSIKALKTILIIRYSQKGKVIMENEFSQKISPFHIVNKDALLESITPERVFLLWILSSMLFIIPKWKKREGMISVMIMSLLLLFQSASCAPIKYVANSSSSTTGHYWTGISAEKNKYYCLHGFWGLGGSGVNYITNAYDSAGNFLEQRITGFVDQMNFNSNAFHAVANVSGGCRMAEININGGTTDGKLFSCTGSINSCPEFTFTTNTNINIVQKLLPIAAGGFLVVGWSVNGAYVKKYVSGASWAWEQTLSNSFKIFGAVELADLSYLVLVISSPNCLIYPYTVSGSNSANYPFTQGESLICYDIKLLTDGGILVAGQAFNNPTTQSYITKRSTTGVAAWTQTLADGNNEAIFAAIQHSDGNIITAGVTSLLSQGGTMDGIVYNLTSTAGTTNWFKAYGGANMDYFADIAQATDYSVVAVGRTEVTTGNYALYAVTIFTACPSGLVLNAAGNDCVGSCQLGYQLVGVTCQPCPAGTNSSAMGTPCTGCPVGTYQDQVGQTSCKNCSIKTISSTTGATACTSCLAGYFQCQTGKSFCYACNGFCGPCKFYDRGVCLQLNSMCWADYEDSCAFTPNITSDCINGVAKTCYKIWLVNGTSDPTMCRFCNLPEFYIDESTTNISISSLCY